MAQQALSFEIQALISSLRIFKKASARRVDSFSGRSEAKAPSLPVLINGLEYVLRKFRRLKNRVKLPFFKPFSGRGESTVTIR
jgi:1-acyl-sn-glycerol-3-phosphate acyltransferase